MLEKEALNISNIVGFDHENEIANKEQKIKKVIKNEVKTEPVDENITQGIVKVGAIDKNSKRMKMIAKQAFNVPNTTGFDHIEEQKIKKEIKTEFKIEPIDDFDKEIEKQALDASNITGFDHENQTNCKEPKIKQEIKTEVKIEPIPIDDFDEEIEKQALDVSNITGFDHQNQTIGKDPKIKQEVKIEPMGENFNV